MSPVLPLPRDKFEVNKQLEAFHTPLEKIDYLEVLSHELRNKLDWMKRKEAATEPGNELEQSNRQGYLSAEMHLKREIKKLQEEHKKDLGRRKKLVWWGRLRLRCL